MARVSVSVSVSVEEEAPSTPSSGENANFMQIDRFLSLFSVVSVLLLNVNVNLVVCK